MRDTATASQPSDGPSSPAAARLLGVASSDPAAAAADLLLYLGLLAGEQSSAGELLDVRWRTTNGRMARRFVPAGQSARAARLIGELAAQTDVYVGVALRQAGKGGGMRAIGGVHLLHVDLDDARTGRSADPLVPGRLASFALPTLEIASGGIGHRHLYWQLSERVPAEQAQDANRGLALYLGGDPAAVDVSRILRPPSTLNYRYEPPRPVRLLAYREHARYALAELTRALPPDPRPSSPRRAAGGTRAVARSRLDRELDAIPPQRYVSMLAGLTPDAAGMVCCPFHDDRRPSMKLYPDGHVHCFGCGWHGWLVDFAAALAGVSTKGSDFLTLRIELARRFGLRSPRLPG